MSHYPTPNISDLCSTAVIYRDNTLLCDAQVTAFDEAHATLIIPASCRIGTDPYVIGFFDVQYQPKYYLALITPSQSPQSHTQSVVCKLLGATTSPR